MEFECKFRRREIVKIVKGFLESEFLGFMKFVEIVLYLISEFYSNKFGDF